MAESEMVERVARAILLHDYGCTPEEAPKLWLGALSTARVALEAMREPTGAMISAIISECENQRIAFDEFSPPMYPGELYRQAISAALGQEGTEG